MSLIRSVAVFRILAGLGLAAGVFCAYRAVQATAILSAAGASRAADVQQLRPHEESLSEALAAEALFATLPRDAGVPFAELTRRAGPPISGAELRTDNERKAGSWIARDVEMVVANVSISEVMLFVRTAEQQRPPIKLIKCVIRASSSPGVAEQIVLGFTVFEPAE